MTGKKLDERMIVAGSGGQGVLLMGKLLCRLMMDAGKHVTYVPSYGAEVRGGTCHCHVRLSDAPIYSPRVENAATLVVMNAPSYERFRSLRDGRGLLLVNSSVIAVAEEDKRFALLVPASAIADELGDVRVTNMVLLGALNQRLGLLSHEALRAGVREFVGVERARLAALNDSALCVGAEAASRAPSPSAG
ncbi:MAG: 2-oxoacid:acceptor oxidoreductase family protein [Planctomycetota bacterium]